MFRRVTAHRNARRVLADMSATPPAVSYRTATIDDAPALAAFGRRMFEATFGAQNDPDNLALYLAATYGDDVQRAELRDHDASMIVADADGEIAGYAYVKRTEAPRAIDGPSPIEIVRFYVGTAWHGTGVAHQLMDAALDAAARMGAETVWLGVWERNPRGIRFYEKRGFKDAGAHTFMLGRDRQNDRLMTRSVRALRGAAAEAGERVSRPPLTIRLQKGRDGRDVVACVRTDGTGTWVSRPGGVPRRDRALLAIEGTVGSAHGVFGRVAGGADLADLLRPDAADRNDAAGWALRIASILDAEAQVAARASHAEFANAVGASPDGLPLLSDEVLDAIRESLDVLDAAWRPLSAGEALEFAWTPGVRTVAFPTRVK
jgi:ribosomal protein S18 acetylase RimI-like enzyme